MVSRSDRQNGPDLQGGGPVRHLGGGGSSGLTDYPSSKMARFLASIHIILNKIRR